METTLSLLSQFSLTKEERKSFFAKTKGIILSGERNPLEFASYLKSIEEIVDELRKDSEIENAIQNEYAKHGSQVEMFGAKFKQTETGVRYDFSECGSSELKELQEQQSKLTERIKEVETFLKAIKEPKEIANPKTGEIETIYPPVKKSKTKISVTLCK